MDGIEEFIHAKVLVRTHDSSVYRGTLLGIDQYLNAVLQDVESAQGAKKTSLFIKGSNILHVALEKH